MDTEDQKFASATRRAMETGDILPLLKVELKYLIQSRRLSEGKEEMSVSFCAPPPINEVGCYKKQIQLMIPNLLWEIIFFIKISGILFSVVLNMRPNRYSL